MVPRDPRRRAAARVAGAALALLLVCGQARAADLYQWTDEQGNVRYTPDPERVPSGRRDTVIPLEPGAPRTPAAPPRAAPDPVAPAPSTPREQPAGKAPAPAPSAAPIAPTSPTPATAPAPSAAPAPVPAPAPAATATPAPTPSTTPPPAEPRAAPAVAAPAPLAAADAEREQQLLAAIAADEDALKALISSEAQPGEPSPADSEKLREIAQRLPGLQAELAALRARRAPPARP
jgi:hypothetical protein